MLGQPAHRKLDAVGGVYFHNVMAFDPQNVGNKHGCLLRSDPHQGRLDGDCSRTVLGSVRLDRKEPPKVKRAGDLVQRTRKSRSPPAAYATTLEALGRLQTQSTSRPSIAGADEREPCGSEASATVLVQFRRFPHEVQVETQLGTR